MRGRGICNWDDYCPGTLFVSGDKEEEYFAFCGSSQEAPDLVRLTKAGSSKVFMENVVQCEPYAGVTGFFQHGGERFMDSVPKEWDWSGRSMKWASGPPGPIPEDYKCGAAC